MKKKILGIILSLMLAVPAFASVGVSPTKIEINANKVKTNYVTATIDVKGDTQKPVRFKVYPGYFKIDNNGKGVLLDKSNEAYDLSKRLRYVPSEFTVAPGKSQKLRINIANLNALPDGESRAMLYVEDVNAKEYAVPNAQGIGAQLIVKTRIGVPVYVDKGKTGKTGEIEHFKLVREKNGIFIDAKLLSKGVSRINCEPTIQIIQGKKLVHEYSLDPIVVGGGTYSDIKQKLDTSKVKGAGEYTVRLVVTYYDMEGKKRSLKQESILNIQGEM